MNKLRTGAVSISRQLRVLLFAAVSALLCLAALAATAQAEITYQASFGELGSLGGKFDKPAGVAINQSTNDVYVADYGNNRVEQFHADGSFVRAWGYDVVSSGTDNLPSADEVDEVQIRASGGSFRLGFGGESTGFLPFDASPGEVQTALNGLTTIASGGGSVSVSGGPGDSTGSDPYLVTFDGGPLQKKDVQLTLDPSALSLPSGSQLSCQGGGVTSFSSISFRYQWLANGSPVAGATAQTFIPGAAEAGKAIQCLVFVKYAGGVEVAGVSQPYSLGSGPSSTPPPLAPGQLQSPTANPTKLPVGQSNGAKLTCKAGTWTRNPESYVYRWYRNGVEIGSSAPTAATTDVYTLSPADTAEKAHFQCSVTASNAGGSSIAFSEFTDSEPKPDGNTVPTATATVAADHASRAYAKVNGGAVFETCNAGTDDICKSGVEGSSFGQFDGPRSIAVDNSLAGQGAVYVHDELNFRVQKFTADGEPVLAFGKEVDLTTQGDVCTEASGHVCGPGLKAIDESPVAIGFSGKISFDDFGKERIDLGNQLAVDPAGHVYLAEVRRAESDSIPNSAGCPAGKCQPRVQKFDSAGNFISMARLGARYAAPTIGVDSKETVYVSIANAALWGLERIYADEFGPTGGNVQTAGNFFLSANQPRQISIDPRNDRVLVSDINLKEAIFATEQVSVCGGPRKTGRGVVELDLNMQRIDCTVPLGEGNLSQITGMAVSDEGQLFAAAGKENAVKIFNLPVPTAPEIVSESAKKITTQTADLHALIKPGFEETSYRVEYGLESCEIEPSACTTVDGAGVVSGLKPTDAVVNISGLKPNTVYHYRLIAENALGEDVGEDKTFTTFALVNQVDDACPNALARKQTTAAGLLDCRAYELVSAGWTGGYDVVSSLVPGQEPFDGFPYASDKVLYGVKDGGIPGAGNPTNRGIDPYLAQRDPDQGWITQYIGIPADNPYSSAPFSSSLLGETPDLGTFAFGGPGICDPCFADGSSGAPVRMPDGQLIQGMAGSEPHPDADRAGYVAAPLSADGKHLVFGADSVFAPGATDGQATLYERDLGAVPNTEVISTRADGSAMSGEVGELAITSDGSRTVVGEEVGQDDGGNPLWHLYLHVRGSANSIDLTEGTTTGAHFSGMTADGSTVFFSTVDPLPVDQSFFDEDESIDIYRATVDGSNGLTRELVTVGSDGNASNADDCEAPGLTPWNAIKGSAIEGSGKCNAVPLAGGAGVADDDGTFYFVSPEQLEAGEGLVNQPNLYVVHPGGAPQPQFVALLDNSLEKPAQVPPSRPLVDEKFADTEWVVPGEMTVDQDSEDVYLMETHIEGTGHVHRYHPDGTPDNFTAGPAAGTNRLDGFATTPGSAEQLAVDNSPGSEGGPLENALYVPDLVGVHIFAASGEPIGALDGSGTATNDLGEPSGSFSRACGVAVDQATGAVYVADRGGYIWQYTPNSPSGTIDDSDYSVQGIKTKKVQPCSIAVDTIGNVYAAQFIEYYDFYLGGAYRWSASSFAAGIPPEVEGTEVGSNAAALATDPKTNYLYLDTGGSIRVYHPNGIQIESYGAGELICGPFLNYFSRGVAVNASTGHTYASCFENPEVNGSNTFKGTVREWEFIQPPYTPIDNPAVVNGVHQPEVHTYGDFQVTPEGRYAAFATGVPTKAGYDNGGKYEVYRYQPSDGELLCVSCDPTGSQASTDSVLPHGGLGLLTDGRMFFTTGEALTLADSNGKLDAYEWSPKRDVTGGCQELKGCQQLISTGTSEHPAGMLGATADGKDAFFFTREPLVPQDLNGKAMRIYDAREQGGFFVIPPPPPCAASDECHGPSSETPPPPQIGTFKGKGGQFKNNRARRCKKGLRRKHGRCVPKQKQRKHHKRKGARRNSQSARQGGSR